MLAPLPTQLLPVGALSSPLHTHVANTTHLASRVLLLWGLFELPQHLVCSQDSLPCLKIPGKIIAANFSKWSQTATGKQGLYTCRCCPFALGLQSPGMTKTTGQLLTVDPRLNPHIKTLLDSCFRGNCFTVHAFLPLLLATQPLFLLTHKLPLFLPSSEHRFEAV